MTDDAAHYKRKFYGRTKGKALRPKQQWRMENILPKIEITLEGGVLDLPQIFGNSHPIWLEIGFGGGEHLAHMAAENPNINFIGCEPYINGVASILRHIEDNNLHNIRLYPADARDLFEALPDAVFSRVYLLYPDPWPKARHAERRFMHPDNLAQIRRLIAKGGELRLASDIPEYIDHGLEKIGQTEGFTEVPRDRLEPWENWFRTRYEAKAIREGRTPQYVIFS